MPADRTDRRGPCERHLENAVTHTAPLLRAAVVGTCGVFGLVGQNPAMALLMAVATGLPVAQSRFRDRRPVGFLAGNALVSVVVGLSQLWTGAAPVAGWVVVATAMTAITCYFEWPDRTIAAHGIALVAVLAHTAGCVLAGGGVPVTAAVSQVVQALLSWIALLGVRRVARLCDAVVRNATERRVTAAVERAQRDARLAHLALLHDTASTTFLMVSTNAARDYRWLPGQARRDLELLSAEPAPDAGEEIDLADLLASLAGHQGLAVAMDVEDRLPVPAEQALAIYHGVREALANVRRHTDDPSPALRAHVHNGQLVVRLSDRGPGFDPDRVPPHRRGLSHSVHARMAAVGGAAVVRSAPGRGTTVEWSWSRD